MESFQDNNSENIKQVNWHHPDYAIRVLKNIPFLRRLSDQTISNHLKNMKLVEKVQNDIIFPH